MTQVLLVDDHAAYRAGGPGVLGALVLARAYPTVEHLLADRDCPEHDAVLLDLQLDGRDARTPKGEAPAIGTTAVRRLVEAGVGPIVVHTGVVHDAIIAACLAAGALGAVSKDAPTPSTLEQVVQQVIQGRMWVDPLMAGALRRVQRGQHAGALSAQQAAVLQLRAQGLKMETVCERIGVTSQRVASRYLSDAVDKLLGLEQQTGDGRMPTPIAQDLAVRMGLADGLVVWDDLDAARRRARHVKGPTARGA